MNAKQSLPITDSPWLWFALFSAVGLTALGMTGGKFGNRQAGIERRGQARAAVGAGLTVAQDGAGRKTADKVPEYSRPGMTKVRLKPLAITLGAIFAISVAMLVRERLRLDSGRKQPRRGAD
jgi:hypothetical protein